jgi:Flp pilus assembly protein TadD
VRTLTTLAALLLQQARERSAGGGKDARSEEAIRLLRRALAVKPNDADGHTLLGRALLGRGERRAAIEALRVPALTRPEDFRSHLRLAEALAEDGRLAEARRHLGRAAGLAPPGNPEVAAALRRLARKEKKTGPPGGEGPAEK